MKSSCARWATMLWATLLSLVSVTLSAGAQSPRANVNVESYRFGLEVSDRDDVVRGQTLLEVGFNAEVSELALDLEGFRAEDGLGMRVESVEWLNTDQKPSVLRFDHSGSVLTIENPGWGAHANLRIRYSGRPSDGFLIGTNKHGDRTFFADHWPNRAHRWLPVVDHPSDKALCSFEVTAPSRYQVVGCGRLREVTDLEDGRRRTLWASESPMATKVMAVGIARFAMETVGSVHGVPVQSWVYPQDREAGFSDFAQAVPILHFFSEKIGPYPYTKLANVQSKTRWGGLENASNVFYNENSVRGDGSNEGLIAHEVAHQWFGDAVSETDWHHVWLSEGFATYLTQVYLEFAHGRDRLEQGMRQARERVIRYGASHPDARIIDPSIDDPNEQLSAYTYQKGAWVLHMLRGLLGDEAFFATLQDFYASFRDGNAETEDFVRLAERHGKRELSWFFEQWLEQPGHPRLEMTTQAGDGATFVRLRQVQSPVLRLALALEVQTADGLVAKEAIFDGAEAEVRLAGEGLAIELDPDAQLLFELVSDGG